LCIQNNDRDRTCMGHCKKLLGDPYRKSAETKLDVSSEVYQWCRNQIVLSDVNDLLLQEFEND
jgi:hypothetical protein